MDRKDIMKSLFNIDGKGLEIGASYNPLLRKSDGYNVEIADYTSRDNLIKAHPAHREVIEEVDYITNGGRIVDVISDRQCFDYIIASHVIEHSTDLLGFLKDCQDLLREDGVLVLAVPDKRHCFDVFQSISSTGEILQAHLERRRTHPPGKHFDHGAYATARVGHIVWPLGCTEEPKFVHTLAEAMSSFRRAAESTEYFDCHAWRFTPSSFRLIVNDLHEIGEIQLKEASFIDSIGPEFFVSLSRSGTGCGVDRMTLTKRTVEEISYIKV